MITLKRVKAFIRKRKSVRFLKKHNCRTYKEYSRKYDKNINTLAKTVRGFYTGYVYVYEFHKNHPIYHSKFDGFYFTYPNVEVISQWLLTNCSDANRLDGFSGYTEDSDFVISYLGVDKFYVAFNSEIDYTMFLLKWSE